MRRIRQLERTVIDQIAAGEVVERPASVVKELVENALDAGATRIELRLSEGGRRRIEVRDDGHGIAADDLLLAVRSHATSKLAVASDLESVGTLGFRGEALASISAVSRLEITSRTQDAEHASCVGVRFGAVEGPRDAAGPPGTRIVVEDLFAELPARLKFLKRPSTELAHATSWVERLALAHLGTGFRVEHEGRLLFEVQPEDDLAARLAAVYGDGLAERMVVVEEDGELLRLEARVGPPESARRTADRVHVFLNGRWVRDARLLRAVREGVREFVPVGHYPTLYLALAVPPERVDVNVHPQKTEVRLRDERLVFGTIVRSLQRGLSKAPWATRSVGEIGLGASAASAGFGSPRESGGGGRGDLRDGGATTAGGSSASPSELDWERPLRRAAESAGVAADAPELPLRRDPEAVGAFVSVAKTFLVREVPGGMEILDQHALHERVNLEELRREVRAGGVVAQPLLVPALVELDRTELDLLLERAPTFQRLGVELEAFGEGTIAIRTVPARLTRLVPEKLVADLLELCNQAGGSTPDQILEETLHRMSCRGAVMAGDHLEPEDLEALLRRGAHLPQDRTCAHGRPVRVFLSVEDLERAFHRR